MSAVWSKTGIFQHINLKDVFICIDRHATKEAQKATPVHSISTTAWKSQSLPPTAEIDAIAPGMTAI